MEALLTRYETKERSESNILNLKAALVEKADRSDVAGLRGSLLGGPDEIGRRLHTLQAAVEELQTKGREVGQGRYGGSQEISVSFLGGKGRMGCKQLTEADDYMATHHGLGSFGCYL